MSVIEIFPLSRASYGPPQEALETRHTPELLSAESTLRELLTGARDSLELPDPFELASGLASLAEGRRNKLLLPLGESTAEFAVVRQGPHLLVSLYETGSLPDLLIHERRVDLRIALEATRNLITARMSRFGEATHGSPLLHAQRRLHQVSVTHEVAETNMLVQQIGGAQQDPGDRVPIEFGFSSLIPSPTRTNVADEAARADLHGLLFEGRLWAYVRGRRITLFRGPLFLGIQRLAAAARSLLDATETSKALNVRLRVLNLVVGIRRERNGEISWTLGIPEEGTVTVSALSFVNAIAPIVRIGTDFIRSVVEVDPAQSRNLRLRTLREEIGLLRRSVRSTKETLGFVNDNPERVRLLAPTVAPTVSSPPPAAGTSSGPGKLRYALRWRAEIDGLEANSTFLCGDRIVAATPRRTVAFARATGEVLWAHATQNTTGFMVGQTLMRASQDGALELCDVAEGEAYARTAIAPIAGRPQALSVDHPGMPATAILAEGRHRIVAIDLRNGEPRWRFASRGATCAHFTRSGRLITLTNGTRAVHTLDAGTGEVLWRHSGPERFATRPLVHRDRVYVVATGESEGALICLDLFSGELRWKRSLGSGQAGNARMCGTVVLIPIGAGSQASLSAFDAKDGELLWLAPDPAPTGSMFSVDDMCVFVAPGGRVLGVESETGMIRWEQQLARPCDDVPRRLEPVLRAGALFVPAANVHIIRPHDGSAVGPALDCELIPDFLRVDEMGWLYVAEESGHIRAFAPAPNLMLVR